MGRMTELASVWALPQQRVAKHWSRCACACLCM